MSKKITPDMTIGEIMQKFPASIDVLREAGIHCIGCGAAQFEPLSNGLARHGITDAEIAGIIERMNEAISEE
jgi:hybrid cluster-associated redox disulfide protein